MNNRNHNRLQSMKEGMHKARSGLIRVLVRVRDNRIEDIIISGDFILTPEYYIDEMEKSLLGVCIDREEILKILKKFYEENDFQSPETYPEDFTDAIMKAINA